MDETTIRAVIARMMAAEQWDEQLGLSYWPRVDGERLECVRCTDGARVVAAELGGEVWGYPIRAEDSRELVAFDCGGHDFAVVGGYLVDYWAEAVTGESVAVLALDDPRVAVKYKARGEWQRMPGLEAGAYILP